MGEQTEEYLLQDEDYHKKWQTPGHNTGILQTEERQTQICNELRK